MDIVLIIGAGRSGTNLLARILERDARFVNTFENRYIWSYRAGHRRVDRRTAADASAKTTTYIRQAFAKLPSSEQKIIVDKTPSNALRIGFVTEVFPEAKIVNIIRDGRASVVSRMALWDSLSRKREGWQRFFVFQKQVGAMWKRGNIPSELVPRFLVDSVAFHILPTLTRRSPLAGERVAGFSESLAAYGPIVARAVQWRDTVMTSIFEGRRLSTDKYFEIKFEYFLSNTESSIDALSKFLGVALDQQCVERMDLERAHAWKQHFDKDMADELEPFLRPSLEFLGYNWDIK